VICALVRRRREGQATPFVAKWGKQERVWGEANPAERRKAAFFTKMTFVPPLR